jgi:hypothetical protein
MFRQSAFQYFGAQDATFHFTSFIDAHLRVGWTRLGYILAG